MNNKGQSLVLFILIIPILLGIVVLVIDCGNALVTKNKINNVIEMVLEYGLEEDMDEEKLNNLIDYNLDNGTYDISIEDEVISVEVNSYVEGIFSNILDIDGFHIVSEYMGYMENDKKVIEKVK